MSTPKRHAAEVFGHDITDRLVAWAIDALDYPPADIATFATRVPAEMVREGRAILEDAGIDWRSLKAGRARSKRVGHKEGGRGALPRPDR